MKTSNKKRSPWAWIPTLYFAQGLPYVAVMTISVIMYKRLGMSNTDIALYTGWLGLPWVIKPFWSPFVDLIKTKRWWTLTMQWIVAIALAGIAFTIPTTFYVQFTFAIFMLMGLASATHDIAADGYYMLALAEHEQSLYVGIRSTFYRIATVVGQGLLVILAGLIELNTGLEPVEMNVTVDPSIAPTIATLPTISNEDIHQGAEPRFIVATSQINSVKTIDSVSVAGKKLAFPEYASLMRDSIDALNVANGFVQAEKIDSLAEETKEEKWFLARIWSPFKIWLKETFGENEEWSPFRIWLKESFGEKRGEIVTSNSNFGVAAFRLDKAPKAGEEIILILNFKEGDQSIKLHKDVRLVFTSKNWDKLAYVTYDIDSKLKTSVTTVFQGTSGNIPMAWSVVFIVLSIFFFIVVIYHNWALPKPKQDGASSDSSAAGIFKGFVDAFKSFFVKFPVWQTVAAILFMLLYRFPEAQLTKIITPFLLDPIDKGGLGLTTGEVGLVYGTVGIIGLTIGGIIGGLVAAKGGLKKWLQPMAWSMSLTCLTFVYLSYFQDHSLLTVNICVFIEQFGYGFGFTAYMLYLIYYAEGKFKTSHYAICTGFMALSMMTGMIAGWIQETIGYKHFFVWTMICCIATVVVAMLVKVDPKFGLKENETKEVKNL